MYASSVVKSNLVSSGHPFKYVFKEVKKKTIALLHHIHEVDSLAYILCICKLSNSSVLLNNKLYTG